MLLRIVLALTVLALLSACATNQNDKLLTIEEADHLKHEYLCNTLDDYAYLPWEKIPHCVSDKVNQQQARALAQWIWLKGAHSDFEGQIAAIKALKPYLRKGDYYYYLNGVYSDARDRDDPKNFDKWVKLMEETNKKITEHAGGTSGYWSDPSYSKEREKRLLIDAAKRGDYIAQGAIGEYYLKGTNGFEQDIQKGLKWMEQAGNRDASNFSPYNIKRRGIGKYFSEKDLRYWKIMHQIQAKVEPNERLKDEDDFDYDTAQRLLSEVKDWKHFCRKFSNKRWLWPGDELPVEKYNILRTIIVQCVTANPPAEEKYINDIEEY